ncbi:hypothetical protein [Bradyrhizobium sp. 604_D8_N2_3]|uniref:hypothetical protein n=1 Tax=Bradyrhizobium sp. 604_D8_N2_3 TaxID=3240370 RepID=UPI003F225921
MKAAEYAKWLEQHQLTHEAAGETFGFSKSTSSRYANDIIPIPRMLELAIEALEARWQRKIRKP